ncbi:unnamed protein product [Adineta ricciae]|uniref:F-box domain-containing protein n=1 Tax=Adineta ricciae TaxID=249248 RepID=A0A815QDA7_ADIRI|nr:unnamed protein product [Adineta ricciae]
MNLLDLPDEILVFILKKMNVVDTLYRQSAIHDRLDRLLFDHLYVDELDFTIKSWDNSISPMNDLIIDRVCEQILPHIHDKVRKLIVEPSAVARVLHAVDFPNVSSLSLMNFSTKILIEHLIENRNRLKVLLEKMTHLHVYLIDDIGNDFNLFELIISQSKSLLELTFHQSSQISDRDISISQFSSTNSSTLTKLNIELKTFDDCLFLLDGRFPSLSHYIVYIEEISSNLSSIDNRDNFSQLKSFSLTSYKQTYAYDDLLVPFLQRMLNLEELHLSVSVTKRDASTVVDGNHLQTNILTHLSQLKRFHFSIHTSLYRLNHDVENQIAYPSNDQLQQQVRSYVHECSANNIYRCHVYSIPYQFKVFLRLSSTFTTDMFINVRTLVIYDTISWDYHFFHKKIFEEYPIVTFNRLIDLDLRLTHITYIQQLLCNRYTHLPRFCKLHIYYEQLMLLTNNFTSDPNQFNCAQIKSLSINECFVRSENFSQFFPLLE